MPPQDPGDSSKPRQQLAIFLGMMLLLGVAFFNTIVSLHATRVLVERNDMVEHTRMVADELDATLATLLNLETGERGYLLTHSRTYLEPYELGNTGLKQRLDRLAVLVQDNPTQQRNLARLRPLVESARNLFGEAIALEAEGEHQSAKELVLTADAKGRMDAVRRMLGDMKAEELRVLAARSAESEKSEHYLLVAIPASQYGLMAILVIAAAFLVNRDLRKRVETARIFRELAKSEHEARQVAEAAHQHTESVLSGISEMFTVLDRNWRIVYVNAQATRLTGKPREAVVGKDYWSVFPETLGTKFEEAYRRSMEAQKPEAFEAFDPSLRKWFSLRLYPSPESLTIFAQDITEVKKAQEALVRTEKLAAVGRMAAAVAHEINNPLEAVTNLIWIARKDSSASESVRKNLATADEELRRVAHVAKQALGFYRDSSAPEMVKLSDLMDSVVEMYASRLATKRISLRKHYDNAAVCGYAGELRQLFSNLFANAIDAVQDGGRVAIKISQSHDWKHTTEPGVRVGMADDGCGISPIYLGSLFEPFFTTKPNSTGTGLGLWVAKRIADKHGGWIRVRSSARADRHYTVISVFLPSSTEVRSRERAAVG